MVRPGVFSAYLHPDQVSSLRTSSYVKLYAPTVESKLTGKISASRLFGSQKKYWVKAGADWQRSGARQIGHELFEVETAAPKALAADPAVLRVMESVTPSLFNRYTAGYLRSGEQNYEWLTTNPNVAPSLQQHGVIPRKFPELNGTGEVVGITDSGLFIRSYFFADRLHPSPGSQHRKVINYAAFDDAFDQRAGHGTHVAGTVAGSLDCDTEVWGSSICRHKLSRYEGIAPGAKIHFQDIGHEGKAGETVLISTDARVLTANLIEYGTKLSSNSWGAQAGSEPAAELRFQYSKVAVEHPDILWVFAVGNDGVSIGAPSDSKNVLPVGASTNPSCSYLSFLVASDIRFSSDIPSQAYQIEICRAGTRDCVTAVDTAPYGQGRVWQSDYLDTADYFVNRSLIAGGDQMLLPNLQGCVVAFRGSLTASALNDLVRANAAGVLFLATKSISLKEFRIPLVGFTNSDDFQRIFSWKVIDMWPKPGVRQMPISRAPFSGRGPTFNGLTGPLVVVPGDHYIFSAMGEGNNSQPRLNFDDAIMAMGGTSMATPATSGLIAIYRQYLRESRNASHPTSYLLRALIAVTARPVDTDTDTELFDKGYGIPRLDRIFTVDFVDCLEIGSGQHLWLPLILQTATMELHIVLAYLDPALPASAQYVFFADLDLVVRTPDDDLVRGNNVPQGDAFATNEKVVIKNAKAGEYKVHITASTFAISSERIFFAVAASEGLFGNVRATGECIGTGQNGAKCQSGQWKCANDFVGVNCQFAFVDWPEETFHRFRLAPKQISYQKFKRKSTSKLGVQFYLQNTVNVLRGITICLSAASFIKLADPGLQCVTSVYQDAVHDSLYIEIPEERKEKPYWAAVYCVSNTTCSFQLSWVSSHRPIGGLSVGAIAGIVIAGVVVTGIIVAFIVWCCCCHRSKVYDAIENVSA
jgi:subtilisin family serine protease